MNLQNEDITNIDRILEMYVQDEISRFEAVEISNTLSIEYGYAQFLIAEIRALNDDLSFLRFDNTVRSGNLHPLNNDKFLIRRFVENGGCKQYFDDQFKPNEIESISQRIDDLLLNQIRLLQGQAELDENGERRILELKELLIPIFLKKTPWSAVIKGQAMSALIALGVNPENLESLITSIQNSIDI